MRVVSLNRVHHRQNYFDANQFASISAEIIHYYQYEREEVQNAF